MKILFSPVGNTDPWRNDRDGAMLHIVRHYQPDLIFLFFTESIWEGTARTEGHKNYDWVKLITSISPDATVEIKVAKIENAHDFDSYKDCFHSYLTDLEKKFPKAELILNVTSGTPQMETTLCLEYITYPNNKICVQVATPLSESNAQTKYAQPDCQEVDLMIVNEEEAHADSRCQEIAIISFHEAMVRNQVRSLVLNYDYEAALFLINSQKAFRNKDKMRKLLTTVTEDIKTHHVFSEISKRHKNTDLQKALFHCLLLQMRFKRRDVAETLIRVKTIAEFIIEKYLGKHYPNVIIFRGNGNKRKPYLNTQQDAKWFIDYRKTLSSAGMTFYEDRILGLPAFICLLTILEPQKEMLKLAKKVDIINDLRNSVAHNLEELSLVKDNSEKGNTAYITDAVKAVIEMVKLVYPHIQEKDFAYFDSFNEQLKRLL